MDDVTVSRIRETTTISSTVLAHLLLLYLLQVMTSLRIRSNKLEVQWQTPPAHVNATMSFRQVVPRFSPRYTTYRDCLRGRNRRGWTYACMYTVQLWKGHLWHIHHNLQFSLITRAYIRLIYGRARSTEIRQCQHQFEEA